VADGLPASSSQHDPIEEVEVTTTERLVGATEWEQAMYDLLSRHGAQEGAILAEYEQLADDQESSAAFRYLARMIMTDEHRHHQIFNDLAEALRQMTELRADDEPIPALRGLRADRDRILATTERLLEVEHEDAKELKRLAKEMKDYRETTLWGLLIDLMQDDTAKHIKILEFIRDRATADVV
jgi:hypothetical protein